MEEKTLLQQYNCDKVLKVLSWLCLLRTSAAENIGIRINEASRIKNKSSLSWRSYHRFLEVANLWDSLLTKSRRFVPIRPNWTLQPRIIPLNSMILGNSTLSASRTVQTFWRVRSQRLVRVMTRLSVKPAFLFEPKASLKFAKEPGSTRLNSMSLE